jgi:hypothetical protein
VWIVVDRYGHLEPREQVRQKGGFSKGPTLRCSIRGVMSGSPAWSAMRSSTAHQRRPPRRHWLRAGAPGIYGGTMGETHPTPRFARVSAGFSSGAILVDSIRRHFMVACGIFATVTIWKRRGPIRPCPGWAAAPKMPGHARRSHPGPRPRPGHRDPASARCADDDLGRGLGIVAKRSAALGARPGGAALPASGPLFAVAMRIRRTYHTMDGRDRARVRHGAQRAGALRLTPPEAKRRHSSILSHPCRCTRARWHHEERRVERRATPTASSTATAACLLFADTCA